MKIDGLDYNTERQKLRLMAYGREIQQMVDYAVKLPTREQRQEAAEQIVETMKRVVPGQQSFKERTPMLWYHLALLSDFKLDIEYPVAFEQEDTMALTPDLIAYDKDSAPVRHYGKLLFALFSKLKQMPEGAERDALAKMTAEQMFRSLTAWGFGSADKDRVVSDLARFTDGAIQLDMSDVAIVSTIATQQKINKKKKK